MNNFNYFFTPVGPEYKKKLARNVGIGVVILFALYGAVNLFSDIGSIESESKVTDSLTIPNAERDAKLAAGCKLYPGAGWTCPDVSEKLDSLLSANQIDFLPETLVVTGGPAFSGDPGCGAVLDVDDVTHWFEIDSISNPQSMTVLSENPHPCKVNTTSCFCNAQIKLTSITQELSYFTPQEEETFAMVLLDYIENNAGMKNIEPKFRIGKLNLNFTDPNAIGYCGERPGDSRNRFFEGAIVNGYVKDYGLEKDLPLLCALNDGAKWWERQPIKIIPEIGKTGFYKFENTGMEYDLKYSIHGASLDDVAFSETANSMLLTIEAVSAGSLEITIPRELHDSKFDYCPPRNDDPVDEPFVVLVDGKEVAYDEIQTNSMSRTLKIPFLSSSTTLEIVSMCLV